MHLNLLKSNSEAFYLASQRAEEIRSNDDDTVQSLLVPAVVNLAFSIELSLKFLIQRQGGEIPRTHDLEELFQQLSDCEKNKIAAHTNYTLTTLGSSLKEHASVFQDWRYLQESQKN